MQKSKKGETSQKCISLISSLFELLRFSASEDREHFEALRTFRARWARSENHCVLQCFSTLREALIHSSARRNGVLKFLPHKIVAMSAAKRGSKRIILK